MTDDTFCCRFDRASRKGTGLSYPVKRCGAATLSRHSNLTKRCPLWALSANGHAEVACATSDIGTGTYTIMAQVAADMLGLPLENISIKLGDSSLPQSPVEGGSWIAASVSNGIATTAEAIRDELLRLAKQMPNSPLANMAPDEVALAD